MARAITGTGGTAGQPATPHRFHREDRLCGGCERRRHRRREACGTNPEIQRRGWIVRNERSVCGAARTTLGQFGLAQATRLASSAVCSSELCGGVGAGASVLVRVCWREGMRPSARDPAQDGLRRITYVAMDNLEMFIPGNGGGLLVRPIRGLCSTAATTPVLVCCRRRLAVAAVRYSRGYEDAPPPSC